MARGRSGKSRSSSGPKYPRSARVGETLREIIAEDLVRIDDERLTFVTVTSIDVDPELNRAIVFFDSLDGRGRRRTASSKRSPITASGCRRRSPGRSARRRRRFCSFRPDIVIRSAERIDDILRADRQRDDATRTRPRRTVDAGRWRAASPATTHGIAVVDKPAGVTSHDVVGHAAQTIR